MPVLPRAIAGEIYEIIEEESKRREAVATKAGGEKWQAFSADMQAQEVFLDTFSKTFSLRAARLAAGVELSTYYQWRRTSIHFVKGFNEALEEWHDEIYTSAATRARGYLVRDADTESGYVEDASGTLVYQGADTKLTQSFLKAMYPDSFGDKVAVEVSGEIRIEIDTQDADL